MTTSRVSIDLSKESESLFSLQIFPLMRTADISQSNNVDLCSRTDQDPTSGLETARVIWHQESLHSMPYAEIYGSEGRVSCDQALQKHHDEDALRIDF